MTELLVRAIALEDATITDERIIEARIVPFNETAEVFPGYRERFLPGSLRTIQAARVAVKLETGNGHSGPVVGVLEALEERSDGYYGTLRISETRDGDEALVLARDGAVGVSVGFLIPDGGAIQASDGATEIRTADLREVTLTGTPVYQNAEPIAVRSATGRQPDMTETNETVEATVETAVPAANVAELVRSAVDSAVDEIRAASVETPPVVETQHRGHNYRSFGELVGDVIAYARNDAGAAERLTRSIDTGIVSRDASSIEVRAFASPGTSTVDAAGISPDSYVPDVLELLREGRPVANLFGGRNLESRGNNVTMPRITQGSLVGYQSAQGATVPTRNVTTDLPEFPKATIAGGQGVSMQAAEWGDPGYVSEVVRDLVAAYGEFVDLETIVGDGATPTASYTGILDGATDVPGATTPATALGFLGSAAAAVYAGSRRAPIACMVNSLTWGLWLDMLDSDGRPVITTANPVNPAGLSDISNVGGAIRGIPLVVDDNIPADLGTGTNESPIILGSFRDALLMETAGAPAQIGLTYPDVLTTDITVYGFSALAIRRPAAFAVLSGVVTSA